MKLCRAKTQMSEPPQPVRISDNFAWDDDETVRAANKRVNSVSCGKDHMLFVLEGGTFCSVGDNTRGQLGMGETQAEDDYSGDFSGHDYEFRRGGVRYCDPFCFHPYPWKVWSCAGQRYYYHIYTSEYTLRRPADESLLDDDVVEQEFEDFQLEYEEARQADAARDAGLPAVQAVQAAQAAQAV